MEYIFAGKTFSVIFICGKLFLRIAGKIAKIRTRKNFVPHGIFSFQFFFCPVDVRTLLNPSPW